MRTVSLRLLDLEKANIPVGFVGENEHTQVRIDCLKIYEEYPSAAASLTVKPPKGDPYPAVVVRDGNIVVWEIKDSDLVYPGSGEIQLAFTSGETIAKSFKGRIKILDAIVPSGEVPEPLEDFLTEASAAITAIPETIDVALAEAKSSGEFDGADGYSPTVAISSITGGHTVTITDAEGDHPFNVMDGEKGDPGETGNSGVYYGTSTPTDPDITVWIDPNGGNAIDDTAGEGDTDKLWSADKITTELGTVNSALSAKISEPQTEGTSGQVLTTDGNGGRSWTTVQGGGGGVSDVQVNGTSVVTSGVANVPIASANNLGVVKANAQYGITINSSGYINTEPATTSQMKNPGNGGQIDSRKVIVPTNEHTAVFYGLAIASGDTSQKSSSNSVGTYTEDAKSKISDMLNAPISVSGSTPSITAKAGCRYVCGEVSTLTITVPTSGCIDVTFTSGSTATVLTVTPTKTGVTAVKWANGFDPSSLDANTTYEVNILDGEFGVVGSWT